MCVSVCDSPTDLTAKFDRESDEFFSLIRWMLLNSNIYLIKINVKNGYIDSVT